jgi:hypothetical protein
MLKNLYSVRPNEIEKGDTLAVVVKLQVGHYRNTDGALTYRLYRCRYPDTPVSDDGIPQGDRVYDAPEHVAGALFPVALWAGLKPDGSR